MPDQPPAPDTTPPSAADSGFDRSGVPTFDAVREKIESRYATALGAEELAAETADSRAVEEQYEERERAAAQRLAQIRESMRTDE
jgi:phage shock protein A